MTPLPAVYSGLQPAAVWHHFAALNHIPRPSGHEDAARAYIAKTAENERAEWKTDARGNICVRVRPRHKEGLSERNDAPIVVLQSHIDMVCQKRPDVAHDFSTDPIAPRRQDDRIYASGTTLGADNGMGAAMMLAILTSNDLSHGPLELLFTVEEETGLYGAAHLDPDLVRGRLLVNLDSEDPDEITIGCAGGATTTLRLPVKREEIAANFVFQALEIGGLQGGHSGIQIGEPLGNALKILGAVVDELKHSEPEMRLISIDGGTAHNAIPRDASAKIAIPAAHLAVFEARWHAVQVEVEAKWRAGEPGVHLTRETALPAPTLATSDAEKVLMLLRDLPHGVAQMSQRYAGKVQTSSNLAEIHTASQEIAFSVSNRSFVAADLRAMQDKAASLGRIAGASIEARDSYPAWEPRAESPLRQASARAFEAVTGRAPRIEVVHAGLECGLLSEKWDDLDAVSFGPLIRGAHTPEEWVSIGSVRETYAILLELLADLG